MIMIKGQWEEAETIDDCLKLIRENMGEEFAEKVKEIFAPGNDNEKQISCLLYTSTTVYTEVFICNNIDSKGIMVYMKFLIMQTTRYA